MRTVERLAAIGVVGLALFVTSASRLYSADDAGRAGTVAEATDLRVTRDLDGQGSKLPMIATTRGGRAYVVWRFTAAENPTAGPIPFLPAQCTFAARDPQWATVPGVSVFDGKAWAEPQRLAAGVHECEAVAAWCADETLHLLVTATFKDDVGYHVRYDPAANAWARLHTLPVSPTNATRFLARSDSVYLASMRSGGVKYWRYDGKAWSTPISLDSKDRDRPAVAVGDDGVVHLCWHSVDGGEEVGYATIAADGTVTQRKTALPIHGDDYDVAIGPAGQFMIAYRAELPEGHPDRDAVFVRAWSTDRWSEPTLVGRQSGRMLGSVYMVAANARVLLSWQHRATYTSANMKVVGPVRSYATFDGTAWGPPTPACTIPVAAGGAAPRSILAPRGGAFANAFFPALHADARGRIHLAWNGDGSSYHALITELASTKH
jgi:hypothetical protein